MSKVMHFLLDYSEKEENVVVKNIKKKYRESFYKFEHVSNRYVKAMMTRWLENNSLIKGVPSREEKVKQKGLHIY